MPYCRALASLKTSLLLGAVATCWAVAPAPAYAGRGISIDANTTEIWSDADNAQVMTLPFPVNYGAGLQSDVMVQLPDTWNVTSGGLPFAAVGLTFTNSPSDNLFATVLGGGDIFQGQAGMPAVRLSNQHQTSTELNPVSDPSIFDFGDVYDPLMSSPPPGSCPSTATQMYCYGPMTDGAIFQFIDLSSSGSPGDFELILQCLDDQCGNIGFNLGGLSFSADDFNPANPPSQLVSYTPGTFNLPAVYHPFFHAGTWDFVFRSAAAVPEPGTWASMLVGFGLLGGLLRRRRKLGMLTS